MRWWRVINTLLITLGLAGPWLIVYFDNVGSQETPDAGLIFLGKIWLGVIDYFKTYGFEIDMVPFWLMGLGGILLILYLFFNLFSLITNSEKKVNKAVYIILAGIWLIFLFPLLIPGDHLWGYWLIYSGILSSAILEWQKQVD